MDHYLEGEKYNNIRAAINLTIQIKTIYKTAIVVDYPVARSNADVGQINFVTREGKGIQFEMEWNKTKIKRQNIQLLKKT